MNSDLARAVEVGKDKDVEAIVVDLDPLIVDGAMPDDVAFDILRLVKNGQLYNSQKAAHLLNFFQFYSSHISDRAKNRCKGFLGEWGDRYTHVHTQMVVAELQHGDYLKPTDG